MFKKFIPKFIRKKVMQILYHKSNQPFLDILKNTVNAKRIIIFLSPEHKNVGDHAIMLCEYQFLNDYFKEYNIIEIPDNCWAYEKRTILKFIKKEDSILIHGGGFIGTLWTYSEILFREIVKTFPTNKIVVLPQSIFFSNDRFGREQLSISKQIYSRHPQLYICAREKYSYEFVKNNSLIQDINKCYLLPDLVTYYKKDFAKYTRGNNILLCFRSDQEKCLKSNMVDEIISVLLNSGLTFSYTDTVVSHKISTSKREEEVNKKLQEFAQAKFVITDRLHGMLFSAVTGTPCLFVDNFSKKISGTYEWIKNLEYIKPLKTIECLKEFIANIENGNEWKYTNEHLNPYYNELAEIMKNILSYE